MFYKTSNDYQYDQLVEFPGDDNYYLPLEVDTEYTHLDYDINNPSQDICKNITVQCRSIAKKEGIIYAHPDIMLTARHKLFKHGCVAIDYLEDLGYEVELVNRRDWVTQTTYPYIELSFFTFFGVAELLRIFQGNFLEDIRFLCTNPGKFGIEQGRRLRTFTWTPKGYRNYVLLPWTLRVNSKLYNVRLSIYDTCAVHGITSYANFCSNSGIELKYKEVFTDTEKADMYTMYIERPEDFDNYALGDLYNHDALMGNANNFRKIYESLGLENFYTLPKLTIGSTVARIVESSIYKTFNLSTPNKDIINRYCKYASADWLKRKTTTTGCLNAKVDGGRCRNNRPIDTVAKGVICDIDISSCYGEGLRIQTYPLGIPMLIDYPIESNINEYQTLRQFLKKYSKDLVPGLWQARVSLKEGYTLKYKQDYLASWFPPKDISKMPTDTDFNDTEQWWTVDNVGEIKVLTNEIHNALITHDFIQWLDNVASTRQRKELLDNLLIITALYYPTNQRVDSIDILLERHANHKGKNTTQAVKTKQGEVYKESKEKECHAWYGINLGDMLVNKLLNERKKHPKKTAFNELYKLCINTVYGDMVSPFFTVSNVVVGNNITARARALAWCMEKGLHGWQSITDGCAFDMNRVLHPKNQRITSETVVNLYANNDYVNHTFKPLPYNDLISVTLINCTNVYTDDVAYPNVVLTLDNNEQVTLDYQTALTWINKAAMLHLQALFPNLDILHQVTKDIKGNQRIGQFEFEVKNLYHTATFHGTANYRLVSEHDTKNKMRSYSQKSKKVVELDKNLNVEVLGVAQTENFLRELETPKAMYRSKVFIKDRILKVGDYKRNYKKWKETPVYPGVTIEVPCLIREFSLSQFTFQTYKQLKSWRKEYEKLLSLYGQSYEMFFLNEDETLNYQRMIETIDEKIREGKENFFHGMDKRTAHLYRDYLSHINHKCLLLTKSNLEKRYLITDSYSNDNFEDDNISLFEESWEID